MAGSAVDLGRLVDAVRASPGAYWRARRGGLTALMLLTLVGLGARLMRVGRDLGGAVIIGGIVAAVGLSLGVVIAVSLKRAMVEVYEQGLILSGGLDRRVFRTDEIGSIALVIARYGTAERREVRVLDREGHQLHRVMGDLFESSAIKRALSRLGVSVADQWSA